MGEEKMTKSYWKTDLQISETLITVLSEFNRLASLLRRSEGEGRVRVFVLHSVQ